MITSDFEQNFVNFLISIGQQEQESEYIREKLSQIIDIDIYQIFKYFDKQNKKFLDLYSFKYFLENFNIYYNELQLSQLIKFFDTNYDNNLNYVEFLNMILPLNYNPDFSRGSAYLNLSDNLVNYLLKIIFNEIKICDMFINFLEYYCELRISHNMNRIDYLREIFNIIDRNMNDYFTLDDLKRYFNKNGLVLQEFELKPILRRLDIEKDGRVSRKEFEILLNPDICHYNFNFKNNFHKTEQNFTFDSDIQSNTLNNKRFLYKSENEFLYLSNEENSFNELLKEMIEIENNYEKNKCDIALKNDFNLYILFKFFDFNGIDYISISDFKKGLEWFNLFPSHEETKFLFKKIDVNKNGVIFIENLFEVFYPFNEELYKLTRLKFENQIEKSNDLNYDYLSDNTKQLISKLLNSFIIGESKMEMIKKNLSVMPKFSLINFFNKIDSGNKKYLDKGDVILSLNF